MPGGLAMILAMQLQFMLANRLLEEKNRLAIRLANSNTQSHWSCNKAANEQLTKAK
jgi:hypothetical protein